MLQKITTFFQRLFGKNSAPSQQEVKAESQEQQDSPGSETSEFAGKLFYLYYPDRGINGTVRFYHTKRVVLLAGSEFAYLPKTEQESAIKERLVQVNKCHQHIDKGNIVYDPSLEKCTVVEDIEFRSPSGASNLLKLANSAAYDEFKDENGTSLRQYLTSEKQEVGNDDEEDELDLSKI